MPIKLLALLFIASSIFAAEPDVKWIEEPVGINGSFVPGRSRFSCKIEDKFHPIKLFVERLENDKSVFLWQDIITEEDSITSTIRVSFFNGKFDCIKVPARSPVDVSLITILKDIQVPAGLEGKVVPGDQVIFLRFESKDLDKKLNVYFKANNSRFEYVGNNRK